MLGPFSTTWQTEALHCNEMLSNSSSAKSLHSALGLFGSQGLPSSTDIAQRASTHHLPAASNALHGHNAALSLLPGLLLGPPKSLATPMLGGTPSSAAVSPPLHSLPWDDGAADDLMACVLSQQAGDISRGGDQQIPVRAAAGAAAVVLCASSSVAKGAPPACSVTAAGALAPTPMKQTEKVDKPKNARSLLVLHPTAVCKRVQSADQSTAQSPSDQSLPAASVPGTSLETATRSLLLHTASCPMPASIILKPTSYPLSSPALQMQSRLKDSAQEEAAESAAWGRSEVIKNCSLPIFQQRPMAVQSDLHLCCHQLQVISPSNAPEEDNILLIPLDQEEAEHHPHHKDKSMLGSHVAASSLIIPSVYPSPCASAFGSNQPSEDIGAVPSGCGLLDFLSFLRKH